MPINRTGTPAQLGIGHRRIASSDEEQLVALVTLFLLALLSQARRTARGRDRRLAQLERVDALLHVSHHPIRRRRIVQR